MRWKRVYARIRRFNRHERWPWEDLILHDLGSQGFNPGRLPALAFAINYAWRVRVNEADLPRVCQRIATRAQRIAAVMRPLRGKCLPLSRDRDVVRAGDVADALFETLLDDSGPSYAVLAAKLFHWCCPSVLPPLDSKAAKGINRAARRKLLVHFPDESVKRTAEGAVQDLRAALFFYNEALKELSRCQRIALIRFDLSEQPAGFQRRNTLVRLLDKYLWQEGGT